MLLLALLVTLIQFSATIATGRSPVTHLGSFVMGLIITMLVLPRLVLETLEAATPYLALIAASFLFVAMPATFYATIGDPVCVIS